MVKNSHETKGTASCIGAILCLGFAAVIAVAAIGACASDDDKGWATKTEGAAPAGWTSVG